jgi:hypothetical protein
MELAPPAATANFVETTGTDDLQGLLAGQKSQMESTMAYQSQSAQMNMEYEMHKAATDRLNSLADSIGTTAAAASRQLAN